MKLSPCKLRLVGFFEQLINDVDLKSEETLAKEILTESQIEEVNQQRKVIIERITQALNFNLAALDKNYKELEKVGKSEIDSKLLRKFCFFVDAQENIEYNTFADKLFGHLIIVDRYITDETLAAFRELLIYNRYQRSVPLNNQLLTVQEYHQPSLSVDVSLINADNMIIETTVDELFNLNRLSLKGGVVESIKEAAKPFLSHIRQLNLFNSEQLTNTVKLFGEHADSIHIECGESGLDGPLSTLSDFKIKSLAVDSIFYFKKSTFQGLEHLERLKFSSRHNSFKEPDVFRPLAASLKSLEMHFVSRENGKFDILAPLVNLEELILESKDIIDVVYTPGKLNKLKRLRVFAVQLDVKFLSDLKNVDELELCKVPKLVDAMFKHRPELLKRIKKLDLTNYTISSFRRLNLNSDSFEGMQQLTSLILRSNQLKFLDEDVFFDLKSLTNLDLAYNTLKTIELDTLCDLTNLTTLDISNNTLKELDDDLFENLTSLTHLNLSHNQLPSICPSIGCLSKLRALYLSSNQIQDIPDGIFDKLVELEILNLSFNKIQSIKPNTFKHLGKLNKLLLNSNRLSSFGAGAFNGLSSLTELNLSWNLISQLPHFTGLERLTKLNLRDNRIPGCIGKEAVGSMNLCGLRDLDLRSNQITGIESNAFSSMIELETLLLSGNQIAGVDEDAFADLVNLQVLNLARNKLEFLHPKLFNSQSKLRALDLEANCLRAVFHDTFSPNLKSLGYLCLKDNKLLNDIKIPHLKINYIYRMRYGRRVTVEENIGYQIGTSVCNVILQHRGALLG